MKYQYKTSFCHKFFAKYYSVQKTFPHKPVLKRLKKYSEKIYTTRENGTIKIVYTSKDTLKVYTEK